MSEDLPQFQSDSRSRGFLWLPVVLLGLYGIFALPLVVLFDGNHYFRHVFFNLAVHYRANLIPARTVHVVTALLREAGIGLSSSAVHLSILLILLVMATRSVKCEARLAEHWVIRLL